ncbi:hypothetical protein [Undibacterium sp. Ji49W]|uniref:hypothetical protein n=1 Tax=Undibacterium sp. Ji49W TaxID=3413040 RepID=UPI003BF313E5
MFLSVRSKLRDASVPIRESDSGRQHATAAAADFKDWLAAKQSPCQHSVSETAKK